MRQIETILDEARDTENYPRLEQLSREVRDTHITNEIDDIEIVFDAAHKRLTGSELSKIIEGELFLLRNHLANLRDAVKSWGRFPAAASFPAD